MTHDELTAMTDEQREQWLRGEIEKIIQSANPRNVLKLRSLQARIDGICHRYKDPIARCNAVYAEMIHSLNQLNTILKGGTL